MNNIAVIIPTFNRRNYLEVVLKQLKDQELPNGYCLVIIVVNDGSSDGTFEFLNDKFPEVNVINGTGKWFYTKCINMGLNLAKKLKVNFILLMNDDVEIEPDFIKKTLLDTRELPKYFIFGPTSITIEKPHRFFFTGVKHINWIRYKFIQYTGQFKLVNNLQEEKPKHTEVLPGRGMFFPVEILGKLLGFDEIFFQYNSDTDFCLRAKRIGVRSYISSSAIIYCHHRMTGKGNHFNTKSLIDVARNFFNKKSTLYLPNHIQNIVRSGNAFYLPIALIFIIVGNLSAPYRKRK